METTEFIKLFKDLRSTGSLSDEDIKLAEKSLNLKFSNEYKQILRNLGATRFNGIELNGLTRVPALNVIDETNNFRKLTGIPNDLYVISSLGVDFVKIMQNEKGEIFQGSSSNIEKIADSIFDYLLLDIRKNMNIKSVIDFLRKLNIPNNNYAIGYAEEAFCIEKTDKWIVYTGERGSKNQLKTFENEAEACEDFFIRNINYSTKHDI